MENAKYRVEGRPPQTQALLEALGPHWARDINAHRDRVVAHYAELLAPLDHGTLAVARDIAYGDADRQVLDVHFDPAWAAGARDVVVFLHGGAFVRGRKNANGLVYGNVAGWFARQGIVGVNVEYRLAPQAPYPAGAEDVLQAFRWVQRNIARYGGRPDRIFLMGHSAGGCHVATALFDPAFTGIPAAEVAGAVLVSARLRADVLPDNPNADGVRAYFGPDAALYAQRSPIEHVHTCNVALLVAVAQYENPHLDRYAEEFHARALLAPRTALTRFVRLPLHNHTSIVAHFGSGEDSLGPEITRFMAHA